ncbi:Endonuclease/exonuclease/phosphatase superfamily [Sesbania bispinosa]|nr:Endonuclease/exonuclease/phosphatase superfamily [Sesbania bispinosa]
MAYILNMEEGPDVPRQRLYDAVATRIGNRLRELKVPGASKVVVCNIQVLYNPDRGEIKLGQIRILLDKVKVVSKLWNNAPVVICGDINCTPKSPLYNFISE